MQRLFPALWVVLFLVVSPLHAEPKVYGEQRIHRWWDAVTDDIAQTQGTAGSLRSLPSVFELACTLHV